MSCLRSLLTKTGHAGEDLVGRFGPAERRGVPIGGRNVVANGRFQGLHTRMHPAAQLLLRE